MAVPGPTNSALQPSCTGLTIVAGIDWITGSPHKTPEPWPPISGPLTHADTTALQSLVREDAGSG